MTREQVHAKGGQDADPVVTERQKVESAWHAIEAFEQSGKGSARELPRLFSELAESGAPVGSKLPGIAKHTNGDVVLECAGVLKLPVTECVDLALHAKTKVTAHALREFLRGKDPHAIAALDAKPDLMRQHSQASSGSARRRVAGAPVLA